MCSVWYKGGLEHGGGSAYLGQWKNCEWGSRSLIEMFLVPSLCFALYILLFHVRYYGHSVNLDFDFRHPPFGSARFQCI
jgi:hypothetical protein